MVSGFLDRVQAFYNKLDKMDKEREAALVWVLSAALVFGAVMVTGTLTSGFHLVDDWEFAKYVDWMTLENYSLWDCLRYNDPFPPALLYQPGADGLRVRH